MKKLLILPILLFSTIALAESPSHLYSTRVQETLKSKIDQNGNFKASVRTDIGAAASGANTDITSLTGVLISGSSTVQSSSTSPSYFSGNVSIGTSSTSGNKLEVAGSIGLNRYYSGVSNIGLTDAIGAFGEYAYISFIPSGLDSSIAFYTDYSGVSSGERMRIDRDGNVGIGTSTPTSVNDYRFLQVNGASSAVIEALVNNTRIGGIDSSSSVLYFGSIGTFPLVFRYNVIEKMRIDGNGVGIGTTTPSTALHVIGTITATAVAGYARSGVNTDITSLTGVLISGSSTVQSSSTSNSYLLGKLGIGTTTPPVSLYVYDSIQVGEAGVVNGAIQTPGAITINMDSNNNETTTYLRVNKDGTGVGGTELFRIKENGNVGIMTTAPDKVCEINLGTSDAWRLTYNDSDGSAVNYTDFQVDSSGILSILSSASNVKIGVTSATLTIGGNPSSNGTGRLRFFNSNTVKNWQISTNDTIASALEFTPSTANGSSTFTTPVMNLSTAGTLTVSSGIVVAGQTMNVPDYVFEPEYSLMPLDELKEYIEVNKHLPNFESKENTKNLDLVQDNMRLRKTVEELTLHLINMNEAIKERKKYEGFIRFVSSN